eukprot:m.131006 g.131006  ORF g.131006 m.131006 type:complete len:51 (-) comp29515_c0_seq6:1634-1786(-)
MHNQTFTQPNKSNQIKACCQNQTVVSRATQRPALTSSIHFPPSRRQYALL